MSRDMGRWAQARMRGTVGPGDTVAELPDWPGGDLLVSPVEENMYTGEHLLVPAGPWDQWEIEVSDSPTGPAAQSDNGAWGGQILLNSCNYTGNSTPHNGYARARALLSGQPASKWSGWAAAADDWACA